MHDGRVAGTMADEATRLSSFSHHNVAAAQAFIEAEELCRVMRLTGYHGKDGQVAAANRAKQRITGRWCYFTCVHQARNHNRRHYYQSDSSNRRVRVDNQPHNWPPSSKDTSADTGAPASARSSACAAPARRDGACRGTYPRAFQECLSLLADRRTHDFFHLASKILLASSGTCLAGICHSPPNPAMDKMSPRLFTRAAARPPMASALSSSRSSSTKFCASIFFTIRPKIRLTLLRNRKPTSAPGCAWKIWRWRVRVPRETSEHGRTSSAATGRSCAVRRCTLRATAHMPRSWPILCLRICMA